MKKAVLLFSLVITAAFLGGCGGNEEEKTTVPEKKVASKENNVREKETTVEKKDDIQQKKLDGLTYQIPSNFKEMELPKEQDPGVPYALYQINETFSFNIVTEDISSAPGMTLEEYIAVSMPQAGYDYENEKLFELNGSKFHKTEATMESGLRMQQTTVVNDAKAYVITYVAPLNSYEDNLPIIEKVIQSIKFE